MSNQELVVHYVGYASQPYVRFTCSNQDHYINVGENYQGNLPLDVHRSDGGCYTFNQDIVTCEECLNSGSFEIES